jgi:hypothetical protein
MLWGLYHNWKFWVNFILVLVQCMSRERHSDLKSSCIVKKLVCYEAHLIMWSIFQMCLFNEMWEGINFCLTAVYLTLFLFINYVSAIIKHWHQVCIWQGTVKISVCLRLEYVFQFIHTQDLWYSHVPASPVYMILIEWPASPLWIYEHFL